MTRTPTMPPIRRTGLSHMPFLASDRGGFLLVFSRSDETPQRVPQYHPTDTTRVWKLFILRFDRRGELDGDVLPVRSALPDNEVECSPCLSHSGGAYHLSFIATRGHGMAPIRHRLYRASGRSPHDLGTPRPVSDDECYCGFARPGLVAAAAGTDGRIELRGGRRRVLDTDFRSISRIGYCFDAPQRLLITGALQAGGTTRGRPPINGRSSTT
jgi:hypothetical protein